MEEKVTSASVRKFRLGPVGAMLMVTVCAVSYAVFARPRLKDTRDREYENQARTLMILRQEKQKDESDV